jgi:hypothetical protein
LSVSTSDLDRTPLSAAWLFGRWLRPNLCEIVTTEQALDELAAQLKPAQEDDDVND